MLGILKAIDARLEEVVCAILLTVLMILLGVQVVLRFGFGAALAWSEELIRFLFVWFAYLGAVMGVREGAHIRITALVDALPDPRVRGAIHLVADLAWLAFNIAILWISLGLLETFARFPQTSAAIGVDLWWIYLVVPVSFGLMSVRLIQRRLVQLWRVRAGGAADGAS
jgi:TRAP-type C4-dicarboxylate transport system permease small subunit